MPRALAHLDDGQKAEQFHDLFKTQRELVPVGLMKMAPKVFECLGYQLRRSRLHAPLYAPFLIKRSPTLESFASSKGLSRDSISPLGHPHGQMLTRLHVAQAVGLDAPLVLRLGEVIHLAAEGVRQ